MKEAFPRASRDPCSSIRTVEGTRSIRSACFHLFDVTIEIFVEDVDEKERSIERMRNETPWISFRAPFCREIRNTIRGSFRTRLESKQEAQTRRLPSKDEFFLRQEVGLVSSNLSLQDHHEIKRIECVMNTFDSERKRRNTHVSMPFAVRNDEDRFLSHLVRSRRHGVLAQFLRGDDRRGNVPNISERKNRRRISVIARLEMPPMRQSVMSFRNNGQESTRFRKKTKTCISRPEFRSFRSRS